MPATMVIFPANARKFFLALLFLFPSLFWPAVVYFCLLLLLDRTGERITESIAHVCENINSHQAAAGRYLCAVCSTWEENKRELWKCFLHVRRGDSWMDSEDDISAQRERAEVGPGGRSPISMARRSPKTKSLQTLFTAPRSLSFSFFFRFLQLHE